MNKKLRIATLLLSLMLMLTVTLGASFGCIYRGSPLVNLTIENQTEQTLAVILNGGLVGEVRPGNVVLRNNLDIGMSRYEIEAKNAQGEIVFSRSYVFEDFQKVDDGVYKVVISQLGKGPESSDNITAK